MKWNKFTEEKPDLNTIVFINYKKPNCDEWINGFCFYRGGTFENKYIEPNGYWVDIEGLNINICYPDQEKERMKNERTKNSLRSKDPS